jgi:hypothetical protein
MSSCFIRPGYIHKKLLIPSALIIINLVITIISDEEIVENWPTNSLIDTFAMSIGYSLVIIVPHIKLFSSKNVQFKTRKRYSLGKNILHFFILFLCYLFYILSIVLKLIKKNGILKTQIEGNKEYTSFHTKGFCTAESLEMIFLIIFSHFIFKEKYYRHNIISMILFIISSVLIDLCIKDDEIEFFYLYIVEALFDSIYLIYQKYMIDKLYYSPYQVSCGLGVILFSTTVISSFLSQHDFEGYYQKYNLALIIISIFVNIIIYFIFNLLMMLTITYFGCSYILAIYVIPKLFILLIRKSSGDIETKYFALIPGVLQFLSMFIHLEILELNFLGLNKYSRVSIEKRASLDISDEVLGGDDYEEIAPGYLFYNNKDSNAREENQKDSFELNKIY